MIGLDTNILIAFDTVDHPLNPHVREGLADCIQQGELFAIAPQVFDEYLHVITDTRRFNTPLSISKALDRAKFWREMKEIRLVFPTEKSLIQQEMWMREFKLGRKRILDTAMAATYKEHGIRRLASGNPGDFAVFGVFAFEAWAQ